jgi:endoglucanase
MAGKGLLAAAALMFAVVVAPVGAAFAEPLGPAAQVAQMGRGVNIVGYDPIWQDPSRARFQMRHMRTIRDGGFSTVRINLHAFRHMDANNRLSAQWFEALDRIVGAALAQDLAVILDQHDFTACAQDPPACRVRLAAFWEQVGEHYRHAPEKVVFEILNEPNGALDAMWNDMLVEMLAVVRRTNPTRNVIVGPAFWNNIGWLDRLRLPANDRHLIVTVHYYLPMEFTHQGARWTPQYRETGIDWGSDAERAQLRAHFDAVAAWSRANDRPILLGEFGAYDRAPLASRVAYTSAVTREAEAHGFAWTYWQFDSDFVVYKIEEDAWNEPIHQALVPRVIGQ